jgi:hypothetical protein
MSASKRPSTSSLRRFLTSRPYVPVAEIRRRFGLDELDDGMAQLERDGQVCYIGLPEREASKLQDLWMRNEVELELSVEVRAPVVIGVYPMRIARYVIDGNGAGYANGLAANGYGGNGHGVVDARLAAVPPRPSRGNPAPLPGPAAPRSTPPPTAYSHGDGASSGPQSAAGQQPRHPTQRA